MFYTPFGRVLSSVKLALPPLPSKCKLLIEAYFAGILLETLQDQIFRDVLDLSQDRILQRIRPSWAPSPAYFRKQEEPLWVRIDRILEGVRSRPDWMLCPQLARLDRLISNARVLDCTLDGPQLREAVATVIRCCAEVSYNRGYRSLEAQLHDLPDGRSISGSKEVMQIDKLARYLGLCKDLAKLSRREPFYHSAKVVILEPLTAFAPERPIAALRPCHVHAEVQLILHYEQHPLQRPPRAIGCSKSACFLCDMLIQKLGTYHISFSHRRLYNQWTIKDVDWMTGDRVSHFQHILNTMIDEILLFAKTWQVRDTSQLRQMKFGLESRAVLPLSSASSLSQLDDMRTVTSSTIPFPAVNLAAARMVQRSSEAPAALCSTIVATLPRSDSPPVVDLSSRNLPHRQSFPSNAALHVNLDSLFLIFECSVSSAGYFSIREVSEGEKNGAEDGIISVMVCDLSTSELSLGRASSKIKLWLQTDHDAAFEIEVVWLDDR